MRQSLCRFAALMSILGTHACASSVSPTDGSTEAGESGDGASAAATDAACTDAVLGCPCRTSEDCHSTPAMPLCSYAAPGCGTTGVCVGRRMCLNIQTFCSCDGGSFSTEICSDGIPTPWIHVGACDAPEGTACHADMDCTSGQHCTWAASGCGSDVAGVCAPPVFCNSGYNPAYCACDGTTIAVDACQNPVTQWSHHGPC